MTMDARGRYYSTSQYTAEGAAFGDTRGFSRLWEEDSMVETPEDPSGWERGQIMRSSQPVFVLSSPGPVWDMADPSGWGPNL